MENMFKKIIMTLVCVTLSAPMMAAESNGAPSQVPVAAPRTWAQVAAQKNDARGQQVGAPIAPVDAVPFAQIMAEQEAENAPVSAQELPQASPILVSDSRQAEPVVAVQPTGAPQQDVPTRALPQPENNVQSVVVAAQQGEIVVAQPTVVPQQPEDDATRRARFRAEMAQRRNNVPQAKVVATMNNRCGMCFEDYNNYYDNNSNSYNKRCIPLQCGHAYCSTCLNTLVDTAIREQERNITRACCPNQQCKREISLANIDRITGLGNTKRAALARIRLARQATSRPCPTPNCQHVFTIDRLNPTEVQCPAGHPAYCSGCGLRHPRNVSWKGRLLMRTACQEAEAQDTQLNNGVKAAYGTIPCPQCGVSITKNGGCPHMFCINCHYGFCWMCLGAHNHRNHVCSPRALIRHNPRVVAIGLAAVAFLSYKSRPGQFLMAQAKNLVRGIRKDGITMAAVKKGVTKVGLETLTAIKAGAVKSVQATVAVVKPVVKTAWFVGTAAGTAYAYPKIKSTVKNNKGIVATGAVTGLIASSIAPQHKGKIAVATAAATALVIRVRNSVGRIF